MMLKQHLLGQKPSRPKPHRPHGLQEGPHTHCNPSDPWLPHGSPRAFRPPLPSHRPPLHSPTAPAAPPAEPLCPTKPSSQQRPAPNYDFLQDDPSSDRQNRPLWSELECRVLTTAFVPRLLEERAQQEGGKGDLIIEPHCDFAHIAGCCNQVTSVAHFPPSPPSSSSFSFFFPPLPLSSRWSEALREIRVSQSRSDIGLHSTWTHIPTPPPAAPRVPTAPGGEEESLFPLLGREEENQRGKHLWSTTLCVFLSRQSNAALCSGPL